RMKIEGTIDTTNIDVALETNGARMQTAVTIRWPSSLGGNVRLRKSSGFSFLRQLFSQNIATGDPEFDSLFELQGFPEPWVREVFASADLRTALSSVGAEANELTFSDSGAFWLWPSAAVGGDELEAHVSTAIRASQALFGVAKSLGPYRY